jgi:hypothetical protein
MVPLAIIAAALVVLFPGRTPKAAIMVSAGSSASLSQNLTPAAHRRIQDSYASLPLAFEQNQGQTDSQVKYLARGHGYTLFLTANDAVFSLHSRPAASKASGQSPNDPQSLTQRSNTQKDLSSVVHMHLLGANAQARVEGTNATAGTANYFIGNDPGKWRTGLARYARVSYQNLYPGVNMAFHGSGRELEFDFVLAPGANPAPIGLQFSGNQGVKTDDSGDLIIASAAGNVLLHKPVAYQEQNGARQPVDARFVLKAANQVSFELGNYDRSRELVIDPSVSYATYLGGVGDDEGLGIAFDSSGNAYVTGQTASTNFPVTGSTVLRATDAFVTKISADGTKLIYSTYVGGSAADSGNGIAVDASGDAFVAGGTRSPDFPASAGAFQTIFKGSAQNAFLFELNPSGSTLTYSTYLGGTGANGDLALGVAAFVSSGNSFVYVVGSTSSADFPVGTSPLQTCSGGINNGFVTKLSPKGTGTGDLIFSTCLAAGGGTGDNTQAVAVDLSGNAYVTGKTTSSTFVTTAGAFQPVCGTGPNCNGGLSDAFVTVIKTDGSGYIYSTFLGGSNADAGSSIAVDASGSAYVTGLTSSSTDFPLKSALQGTFGGGNIDAFVTKLNPTGTALVYSTYLGGSGDDSGKGVAVDAGGNAYITGQTNSTNFKTVAPTQASLKGGYDAFVSELNAAGSQLTFSTYLGGTADEDNGGNFGGIAVDNAGANIYVTGSTASTDFPTTSGAHQTLPGGGIDAFVAKFAQTPTGSTFSIAATALSPTSVSPGGSATSTLSVTSTNGFTGTVTIACAVSPAVALGPTCGPASATPTTPATLTVNTTAASASLQQPRTNNPSHIFYAMFLPIGGIALVGIGSAGTRRKKLIQGMLLCLALGGLLLAPACGGSSSSTTKNSGTPAGTYTITVSGTATVGSQTGASPALTLTVN